MKSLFRYLQLYTELCQDKDIDPQHQNDSIESSSHLRRCLDNIPDLSCSHLHQTYRQFDSIAKEVKHQS